jgi:hypothetical protein
MFLQYAVPLVSACRLSNSRCSSSKSLGESASCYKTMKLNRNVACYILSFLDPAEKEMISSSSARKKRVSSIIDDMCFKSGRCKSKELVLRTAVRSMQVDVVDMLFKNGCMDRNVIMELFHETVMVLLDQNLLQHGCARNINMLAVFLKYGICVNAKDKVIK